MEGVPNRARIVYPHRTRRNNDDPRFHGSHGTRVRQSRCSRDKLMAFNQAAGAVWSTVEGTRKRSGARREEDAIVEAIASVLCLSRKLVSPTGRVTADED